MAPAIPASACLLILLASTAARGQDVAAFYDEHCAACHSIGGGAQAGPDLKDITSHRSREWLVRFLVDPEGLVARGDPIAVHLVEEWDGMVMPATPGLTPEVAADLLAYIDRQSSAGVESAADRAFTPTDVAHGRALFTGEARLERGGPACMACHDLASAASVRGGTLGPDLTASYSRLGARRGTAAWLNAPPAPMMRALYRAAPLTEGERYAVVALMSDAAASPPAGRPGGPLTPALAGLSGVTLFLVLAGIAWRKRFRAVRRPLLASMRTPPSLRAGGPR